MKEKIKAVGLAVSIVVTIIVSLVLHINLMSKYGGFLLLPFLYFGFVYIVPRILSYIMDDFKVTYSRENLCITKDDFQTKCFEEALGTKPEEVEHIVEGEEVWTKTKEKATKKLQFLSDLKGVPITEHIKILQFHFKILKLKSQEFYYKGE